MYRSKIVLDQGIFLINKIKLVHIAKSKDQNLTNLYQLKAIRISSNSYKNYRMKKYIIRIFLNRSCQNANNYRKN